MRMGLRFGLASLAVLAFVGIGYLTAADKDEPKHTIKEVMKEAHKDGLLKKVASGKGEKEDKDKLLELYTDLSKNKPSKGDADSWKTKTDALVKAAKSAVDGDKDATKGLTKASMSCKACHGAHK
jgi:hypothetical protein